jgi:hypothetical protein
VTEDRKERIDSQETERKTEKKLTVQKVQDTTTDKFETATDGDDNDSDDQESTVSEGVGDKCTRGRDRKTRHL